MATDETVPGGLLSKVVRFVRNPTVDWGDIDALGESQGAQYSRQKLKEMIERKRRNDFVRKREFEQLRKLRRKEITPNAVLDETPMRSSFLDSGVGERGAREQTLRKIDAIEQQMSQQWWKAHGTAQVPESPAASPRAGSSEPHATPGQTTLAPPTSGYDAAGRRDPLQAFAPTVPSVLQPQSPLSQARMTPVPGALFREDNAGAPLASPAPQRARIAAAAPKEEKFVHEPDLEEAAILFANADYAGAARCLTDVLARHAKDDPQQQHEIWMTLFDLYRATGQQEPFDTLAIDYAARFGRSAPLWFSMPQQLGVQAQPAVAHNPRDVVWSAPAALGPQSVAALQASLGRSASPWTLNWSRLVSIELAALAPLTALFGQWANQAVVLRLHGVDALRQVLQVHTVAQDRSADPQWWLLRMALLRLLKQADDFELVALDYCVTYEVSPPSWVEPRCIVRDGAAPQERNAPDAQSPSGPQTPAAQVASATPATAELVGHIEGDAGPQLASLEALLPEGQPFMVACDRLIRVDFAAVGSVLNWAAAQQGRGSELHFHNLHRLIAVFFNVIGINEHAMVEPRKN